MQTLVFKRRHPMKKLLVSLSILFSLIALPALGALTDADLNQIRLIVQEEIKKETTPINTKIDGLDTRLRNVETHIAELRGRSIAFSGIKDWGVAICALGALIVSIIALRKKQPTISPTPQALKKQVLINSTNRFCLTAEARNSLFMPTLTSLHSTPLERIYRAPAECYVYRYVATWVL